MIVKDAVDSPLANKPPSKSQLKREAHAVTEMGKQLLAIPQEHLKQLPYPEIIAALAECRATRKGNANKRQLQHIGKLLRSVELGPVRQIIDHFDASSQTHATQFKQLEIWRERLMKQDPEVIHEIVQIFPRADRQYMKQLVRNARGETTSSQKTPVNFRRLFQYLKTLKE